MHLTKSGDHVSRAPSPVVPSSSLPFASVHFIGICGAGMSALARALLAMGVAVSGSDPGSAAKRDELAGFGARVSGQHDAANLRNADAVVVSTAIKQDNPELMEARRRRIGVLHRSDLLGLLLSQRKSILVAGTHGKTTTSALVALLMEGAGMDPWAFVGGDVTEFNGNLRQGGLEWAVAEADESDGSFQRLPASHLIITNIEPDHLDYWETPERLFAGFLQRAQTISDNGTLVISADDPGACRMAGKLERPYVAYSLRPHHGEFWAGRIEERALSSQFELFRGSEKLGHFEIGVPGLHNVSNAVGALAVAISLGAEPPTLQAPLAAFHGVGRRFQIKGTVAGITVIDDYAHHPTEIRATLAAAKELRRKTGGRVVAAFQPHRYTRTRDFLTLFARAFEDADETVLTSIYAASEPPIPGVTTAALVKEMNALGLHPHLVENRADLAPFLAARSRPGDIVLTLGAGDITRTGEELLKLLKGGSG